MGETSKSWDTAEATAEVAEVKYPCFAWNTLRESAIGGVWGRHGHAVHLHGDRGSVSALVADLTR